jgi:hypothetical protein
MSDLFIRNTPIIRVLESFNGDLYFISEQKGDEIFCYARLYSMPDCAEWGYNSLRELKRAYGNFKIWDVPKRNWPNLTSYDIEGLIVL